MAEDDSDDGLRSRWATLVLLALNVCVFLAMVLAGANPIYTGGAALAAGGVEPSLVWHGEVWRFLTACFIHLGIWHIGLNGWVLWQLGPTLERLIGGSRTLLIYLSTGVFGFAMSTSLRAVPTAGASGAIFGITGALLAIALMLRRAPAAEPAAAGHDEKHELSKMLLQALVPFIGATLVLGFLVPGIDNTAHVGGLLFGILIGYALAAGDVALFTNAAQPQKRLRGAAALVLAGLAFIAVTAYGARPVLSPHYHAVAGLSALNARGPGNLDAARTHAAAAARLGAEDPSTFVLLGRIRAESAAAGPAGDVDRAEAVRLVRQGLKRSDGDDVTEQFMRAIATLSLAGGTEELPFSDLRTVDALCTAALLEQDEHEGEANEAAELENACAWLRLKSPDPSLRDPAGALALARRAVADSEGKNASIVHTLAEALSQNGQGAEALAHLEKLVAEGRSDELPGGAAFLTSERLRIKRLIDAAPAAPLGSR